MVGSPEVRLTPYRMGTDTQICWVMVTVQLLPQASETQVMLGVPWQAMLTAPTAAVGVRVNGAAMSTHWVPVLLQPPTGQLSSAG